MPPFSLLFALSFPSYLRVFTFNLNCDEVIFYTNYGTVLLESQKMCVYIAVLLHVNCLQCIVVQSLSRVESWWPHGLQHARLNCPPLSLRVCSNSCPFSQWHYPTISSSVAPFSSCPQSFPVSGFLSQSDSRWKFWEIRKSRSTMAGHLWPWRMVLQKLEMFSKWFGKWNSISVQFSHSVVSDSLWPHGLQHARLPCPSPTPRAHSNSWPLSRWCHPIISSSVIPSSSASIFPSIRVFSNESVLRIRWPKDWSFSFSISPSNEYSGLISFRIDCPCCPRGSQESFPTPQLKSINSQVFRLSACNEAFSTVSSTLKNAQ